jgi:hypothetical protein
MMVRRQTNTDPGGAVGYLIAPHFEPVSLWTNDPGETHSNLLANNPGAVATVHKA